MKLFRNLRQSLIEEGKFRKYVLYALGEILLVMIGILLAFQVDKWNEQRLNRIEELKYYSNLKGDLEQYRYGFNGQIDYNGTHLEMFNYALETSLSGDPGKQDTLIQTIPYMFNYSDFDQDGNIYETLVNSGDVKLLSNEKIIKGIRGLEWRFQYINRMENIHWDIILDYVSSWASDNIKFAQMETVDNEVLYSYEFQNMLILLKRVMEEKEMVYKAAIEEIDSLTNEIDMEIELSK
ncbi:DUF6090 family protein [Lentiprolixibacter aurantiacus]|uniref:DUF6090 family protein n=1 Tax=Lentiprolixibacter aurantiacus TaxID=2993939 RepID=A0AAE3SPC4_9FLAO|nr:DUF6090 family protein [Lentiprolixibacter aurantiacus]MCX2719372.1 DUF6090 family protein [Lentiprolixibacter aurantiacus]